MAYIGQKPANRYSRIDKQVITGDGGTTYTLDYTVANENELEVFVNNVRQEPGNAYVAFGTTLSMTDSVTANDGFYVVFQGKSNETISIPEKDSSGYNFANGTLFIDVGNSRVGIGNTTPSQALTVTGNVSVSGNLTVGTGTVIISNDSISIAGSAVSPVQSFRNKIINGNFDIWQRATSGSSGYVADRWNTALNGSTAAISRQSFTLGQTDVPNEPTYFHRVVVTSSAGSSNYALSEQRVESVRTLAGQKAKLSFWAKADASKNMAIDFVQNFGTGGSPSSAVNAIGVTTCALTTSWQKFEITVDVPSISGKTLGTNNNNYLSLVFWFDAGSDNNSRTNSLGQQSGTFDIAQVQLEAGSVSTPFEMRPPGVELQLCQRYYQAFGSGNNIWSGNVTSGQVYYYERSFFVIMRAAPTIVQSGAASSGFPTTDATTNITPQDVRFVKTASSSTNGAYYQFAFTASAEL